MRKLNKNSGRSQAAKRDLRDHKGSCSSASNLCQVMCWAAGAYPPSYQPAAGQCLSSAYCRGVGTYCDMSSSVQVATCKTSDTPPYVGVDTLMPQVIIN